MHKMSNFRYSVSCAIVVRQQAPISLNCVRFIHLCDSNFAVNLIAIHQANNMVFPEKPNLLN